jgi:hypothetical protein
LFRNGEISLVKKVCEEGGGEGRGEERRKEGKKERKKKKNKKKFTQISGVCALEGS